MRFLESPLTAPARLPRALVSIALIALLHAGASAAGTDATRTPAAPSISELPRIGVLFDRPDGEDGALWARGAGYKARFDRRGTTFFPYLGGTAAPASGGDALTFRLKSVELDGLALPFLREVPARREDRTVSFDRGSLREVYALAPESMEQLFVFEDLPHVGELTLRLTVDGAWGAAQNARGLSFTTESGHVTYSAAVAVGGRGLRRSAPTRLEGGEVEIRVPRDAVERMEFPLVIDPVISSSTVVTSSQNLGHPDAFYMEGSDLWCLVWESSFSGSDHDVFTGFVDSSGQWVSGSLAAIDVTDTDWRSPKVAFNTSAGLAMIVAEVGQAPTRAILGRARNTGSVGPVFPISDDPASDCTHPDIGGDPLTAGPTLFCVVWGQADGPERAIASRPMDTFGSPLGPAKQISGMGHLCVTPSISNSCGTTGVRGWGVVWTRVLGPAFAPGSDVYAIDWARINSIGNVVDSAFPAHTSAAELRDPVVSTSLDAADGETRCLVAWTEAVGAASHVMGKVLRGATQVAPPAGAVDLTVLLGGDLSTEQSGPSVDSDGAAFLLGYSELTSGLPFIDHDVFVATMSLSGPDLLVSEGPVPLQASSMIDGQLSLVADRSGGGRGHRYFAAWTDGQLDFTGNIAGTLYQSPGLGAPYCLGGLNSMGTRAEIRATGDLSLGATAGGITLRATGCPPNKPGLFFFGTTQLQTPFGDGLRCAGGQVQRVYPFATTDGAGVVERELLFSSNPAASLFAGGGGVNYQYWYRDPSGGPNGFNLSDGIHVMHTP